MILNKEELTMELTFDELEKAQQWILENVKDFQEIIFIINEKFPNQFKIHARSFK